MIFSFPNGRMLDLHFGRERPMPPPYLHRPIYGLFGSRQAQNDAAGRDGLILGRRFHTEQVSLFLWTTSYFFDAGWFQSGKFPCVLKTERVRK